MKILINLIWGFWHLKYTGTPWMTSAMLCPWARHFTPRKYWLITQEAMAPSRHDWKIVDWDVKPQHKQTNMNDVTIWQCGYGKKAVKASEILLRQRCNIQFSIENTKYIFLKMWIGAQILFRIPWWHETRAALMCQTRHWKLAFIQQIKSERMRF